ncbi:hypothetical protein [Agrobacterium tumefaciens]|uniref:hypothetical protein n=1 Tax=Agrobacterium tumefaciens TaxID=358 RepID=UPI00384A9F72
MTRSGGHSAPGLNAYLVHTLSAGDLATIATAGCSRARIAYYAQRLPDWTSAVQSVVTHLDGQPRHGGKVGILGISLNAQLASASSVGRADVDAYWSMGVSRMATRGLSAHCRPSI